MTTSHQPQDEPKLTEREIALETAQRTAVSGEGGDRGATRVRTRETAASIAHWRKVLFGDAPSLWSEAPATPAEMVRYAKDGEWCAHDATVPRLLGQAYSALVAIPTCCALYVLAWVVQRPGRLLGLVLIAAVLYLFA